MFLIGLFAHEICYSLTTCFKKLISSLVDGVGTVLVRVVAIFAFRVVGIGVVVELVVIFVVVAFAVVVDVCALLNVSSISLGKYGDFVVFTA